MSEGERRDSCLNMVIYDHLNSWIASTCGVNHDSKISRSSTYVDALSMLLKICTDCVDDSFDFLKFFCNFEPSWMMHLYMLDENFRHRFTWEDSIIQRLK